MPPPLPFENVPDDHPSDSLPVQANADATSLKGIGGVLYAIGLYNGINLALMLASPPLAALLIAAMLSPIVWWGLMRRGARVRRALKADPPVEYDLVVDPGRGTLLQLQPQAAAEQTPFDPADPTHLALARHIRTCRVRDGMALGAGEQPPLRINLDTLAGLRRGLNDRVDLWRAVVGFLERRAHPRAAWLAAIACTEETRWRRAEKALTLLARRAEWAETRERALDWLVAHGPRAARTAGALARIDGPLIDRLLAEAGSDEPHETLVALIEARWRWGADDTALARWRAQPALAALLARLPLKGAGVAHWRALIETVDPGLACVACETALELPDAALPAARALLDRPDLQAIAADKDRGRAEMLRALGTAIERLSRAGEREDLRRLAIWGQVPGPLNRSAKAAHRQLKLTAGAAEAAGGLALAGSAEGQGGLALAGEADGGRLALARQRAADGSAAPTHSGLKAKG